MGFAQELLVMNRGVKSLRIVTRSLIGGLLIVVGIIGLVLPVIPGLLLIAIGALLIARLLRNKSPNTKFERSPSR